MTDLQSIKTSQILLKKMWHIQLMLIYVRMCSTDPQSNRLYPSATTALCSGALQQSGNTLSSLPSCWLLHRYGEVDVCHLSGGWFWEGGVWGFDHATLTVCLGQRQLGMQGQRSCLPNYACAVVTLAATSHHHFSSVTCLQKEMANFCTLNYLYPRAVDLILHFLM